MAAGKREDRHKDEVRCHCTEGGEDEDDGQRKGEDKVVGVETCQQEHVALSKQVDKSVVGVRLVVDRDKGKHMVGVAFGEDEEGILRGDLGKEYLVVTGLIQCQTKTEPLMLVKENPRWTLLRTKLEK